MKHDHKKWLIHPVSGKFVCWCKYPFCLEISKMKKNDRERALIEIYEVIKKDKIRKGVQMKLESFMSMD